MEKQFLTPKELFEEKGLESPYNPKPIINNGSNRVLFWHVPAFIEENDDNEKMTELSVLEGEGNSFRVSRLSNIHSYSVDVYKAFDKKIETLWMNEPRRREVIKKAEQLIVRNKYSVGYTMAGLYLDFNALFDIIDNSVSLASAERIIDNNLFLGNMEAFYVNAILAGKSQEDCEKAKKNYLKTLELIKNNPNVHLTLPKEQKMDFRFVESGESVAMEFCDPSVSTAVGYGPQFLCDARIYKKQELAYTHELNSVEANKDLAKENKIKDEIKDINNQIENLEHESVKILNDQLKRTNSLTF